MTAYPCPACGAPADLATGCSGCHRPPDPEAAEVTALNGTVNELAAEVEQARGRYAQAVARLNEVVRRRNELAARVLARVATPAGRPGPAPATVVPPAAPAPPLLLDLTERPARPETSGRTVQNLLFVLGGLLLGSAAIVFTAVAWANFGIAGRAAILGVVTVLVLAVPPVALLRRLAGTAETFAALGLLLVLLDGYAAWAVNLAGVADALPRTRYAGAVFAGTAAIALGYGLVTRLTGPRFAALALAQPVLPLVLARSGLGPAGWAATFAVLGLADLAAVRWARRPLGLRVTAWVLAGLAGAAGGLVAVAAVLLAHGLAGTARSGGALVLAAGLLIPAALGAPRQAWLRHTAGAVVAFALAVGGARVLVTAWPGRPLALVAAEVAVLAGAVRLLPRPVRTGTRVGVLVAAGLAAAVGTVVALSAGLTTASVPLRRDFAPTTGAVHVQLPVALALLALAFVALLPRRFAVPVAAAGGVLVAFALPAAVPLAWWAPSIVDAVLAVPLALAAARTRPAALGVPAAVLAGHAVVVGLARSWSAAAVLAGLLALAAAVAALARRQPVVGALATGVALLVPAGLGAALGQVLHREPRPYAAAGLVLSTAVALALIRPVPRYAPAGAIAVLVAGLGVSVAATRSGWYAGLPVLCAVLLGAALLPRLARGTREVRPQVRGGQLRPYGRWYLPVHLALGGLSVLVPAGTVLPSLVALLLLPYAWVGSVWTGAPAGAGLVPPGSPGLVPSGPSFGLGPAAVTLALLALATGIARYGWRHRPGGSTPGSSTPGRSGGDALLWAAGPASLALLAGAAASHAPWPTVAALSLAVGVAAALLAAFRPAPALALLAVPAAGAGLAQSLATKGATLTALSVVLVTATVCALTARRLGARVAGWLAAVPAAGALALAAARAAEVSVRWSAFGVLTAAAVALGASSTLRTRTERWLVEVAGHASAGVALLLTTGSARHAAGVLTLWGIAVGLRALWPGEPVPHRRSRVVAGVACELLAYWLLLWSGGVSVLEAYTLPAAGVALLAGWLAAQTRPSLHSWSAYGPALLAGFGPSLAVVLAVPGEPLRRLALGLAGVAVVIAGSVRRRQAPVVVGGAVLVLLALHEAVLLWDLLPRWIPLGVAGLVLVGLAVTYERRRRDLRRLRTAVSGMR
jgi:hypothetical protein